MTPSFSLRKIELLSSLQVFSTPSLPDVRNAKRMWGFCHRISAGSPAASLLSPEEYENYVKQLDADIQTAQDTVVDQIEGGETP